MRVKFKFIFYSTFLIFSTHLMSCTEKNKIISTPMIKELASDSFKIRELKKGKYSELSADIVNDTLVIRRFEMVEDDYFEIFDVKRKKHLKSIKEPFPPNTPCIYSFNNNKFICARAAGARKLYLYDIKNLEEKRIEIQDTSKYSTHTSFPSRFVPYGDIVFHIEDMAGILFFNVSNEKRYSFKHKSGNYVQSSYLNYLSFPIDIKNTIISGEVGVDNYLYAYWLDEKQQPLTKIPLFNMDSIGLNADGEPINILDYGNKIIFGIDHHLFAMDKATKKVLWRKKMVEYITDAWKLEDKIIICSRTEDISELNIHCLDISDGTEAWKYSEEIHKYFRVALLNDNFLIKTKQVFQILELQNGKLINEIVLNEKLRRSFSFQQIKDYHTGKYYVYDETGTLYW